MIGQERFVIRSETIQKEVRIEGTLCAPKVLRAEYWTVTLCTLPCKDMRGNYLAGLEIGSDPLTVRGSAFIVTYYTRTGGGRKGGVMAAKD